MRTSTSVQPCARATQRQFRSWRAVVPLATLQGGRSSVAHLLLHVEGLLGRDAAQAHLGQRGVHHGPHLRATRKAREEEVLSTHCGALGACQKA